VSFAEFAFLAAGLVLGAAGGVATAARFRGARRRPEVRVTITPGAVPRRRATTLAGDPFAAGSAAPALGGPGDLAIAAVLAPMSRGSEQPPGAARGDFRVETDRTSVRNGQFERVAVPIVSEPDPLLASLCASPQPGAAGLPDLEARSFRIEAASEASVLVAAGAASGGADSAGAAWAGGPRAMAGAESRSAAGLGQGWARIVQSQAPAPSRDPAGSSPVDGATRPGPVGPVIEGGDQDAQCRDLEREADEQCRLAAAARDRVEQLAAELVAAEAQRDRQAEASRAAEAALDPGRFRAAREAARATFQAARARSTSAADLEEAAGAWLAQVELLNGEEAAAQGSVERLRAGAEIASATAEHLAAELETARSAAEAGDVACVYARRRAAECAGAVAEGSVDDTAGADLASDADDRDEELAPTEASEGRLPAVPAAGSRPVVLLARGEATGPRPAIERVLSGEHEVLDEIVARIADDDDGRRHWTERLTALLEAILLAAVDSAAVEVPADHPFWSSFTAEQSREILTALASLGHHFDGLGGWLDDRAPDQRDLSLAVAHAGLDPMRLRRWPTGAESAELLRDAVILGADYVAAVAPRLSVQELTAVLGREGQALGDVWAEWERVRPALAATAETTS
jgi:hypothetical protein